MNAVPVNDAAPSNDAVPVNTVEARIARLPPKAARLVAVEVLLTDPESLGDDVLEACLYILRERLRA